MSRDPGALLAGRLLKEAREYEDLSELEQEFVATSQSAEDAIQSAKDAIRLRDRRAAERLRWLSIGLSIVTLVALSLAGVVFWLYMRTESARAETERLYMQAESARAETERLYMQAESARAETERQRVVIDSQRLAFAAQTQFRDNAETGLLVAYEANARDDNPVTGQTLRDAIDAVPWRLINLFGHTDTVYNAVFSPDGQRILTASADKTARLWDATGQPLATLSGHTDTINSAVFSLDGTRILTASADKTARLWDATGQPLATLKGHTSSVSRAVFSPDGQRILTASVDKTARLWDATGQPLAILSGHTDTVYNAVFSPDGQRILTVSYDKTARQYLVASADLQRVAACRVSRGLTDAEVAGFQVPTPLAFDFATRQCPPVYSWAAASSSATPRPAP